MGRHNTIRRAKKPDNLRGLGEQMKAAEEEFNAKRGIKRASFGWIGRHYESKKK